MSRALGEMILWNLYKTLFESVKTDVQYTWDLLTISAEDGMDEALKDSTWILRTGGSLVLLITACLAYYLKEHKKFENEDTKNHVLK